MLEALHPFPTIQEFFSAAKTVVARVRGDQSVDNRTAVQAVWIVGGYAAAQVVGQTVQAASAPMSEAEFADRLEILATKGEQPDNGTEALQAPIPWEQIAQVAFQFFLQWLASRN